MKKTPVVEPPTLRRIKLQEKCPNCPGTLKLDILVGIDVASPQSRICEGCGWFKDVRKH